ncbi:trehalose-phosphatase [Trujillonella endophytica]|uniref:Trehalose 6-phosphate phosphatase n=1 Tax=Trujillonella endophytica TaxID=673521 RepID=A0A1H8V8A8_9ACTN|nr:trehalose-phosphatase [Trujillella endophytica]SEP11646.1 trehalose 6-phosphatase [Trujillella endophytica]
MTVLPADLVAALPRLAARRPLLIACDYDGVLARLRDDPSAAVPEPGVAEVLARLATRDGVTVALVSGRGVDDLRRTSGLTGPYRWVGSHGAEFDGPIGPEAARRRDALAARLAPLVDGTPAARLEVKPASVAVHVRQVTDRTAAAALLARAREQADPELTLKPGKDVLELAVTDADKGSALCRLRDDLGAACVLYLGDDLTDEDAFAVLRPHDLGVKVGPGDTRATARVADPTAAISLLVALDEALTSTRG